MARAMNAAQPSGPTDSGITAGARALVADLLGSLPNRRAHSLAVGAEASRIAALAAPEARAALIVAAYLHDIGYAPAAVDTGAHQLDGARLLRRERYGERVCGLVAHHTGAIHEAREHSLDTHLLAEFPEPDAELLALLTYCDLSTGPTGEPVNVEARLADIFGRYGEEHPVSRAMRAAEAGLLVTAAAVRSRLKSVGLAHR